ncbi:MAG: PTS sugar transporter subunit IIA [Chlamydiia bacterium]|nr:PTS sugar transporter subunit IIA [Chlamydiia bacterium]
MDLKIKDVAELLSVSETTIRRWLVEGKIPAYRLNRQYRFSRNEIEDWVMQQKLGIPQEEQKVSREEDPSLLVGSMQFSLYRALYRGEVIADLVAKDKKDLIRQTMKIAVRPFDLDPSVLSDLFLDRERLMSTSLGYGLAVPHTRDFLLDTHFDVITTVFPKEPIDFGALDGQPVHTLFFLFACEDKTHLHLLAKIAHLGSNEKIRAFLQTKPSKSRLLDFIKHWESSL